ncbi:uncharacterized protein LOC106666163 [Cimex lectularius]|uniref:Death domain-containing protein n=1 Tax=Cimex lectularius TaxID=79782 RepID=A0A8I6RLQ2_CIMLE|nr:uncharacterized protein LOC106666163 [Cimex lectularius]
MNESERHKMKMVHYHINSPPRNPKLENLRALLIENHNEEDMVLQVDVLAHQLSKIHASYLFHPKGWLALKEICTVMSATPTLIEFNSWKDLASALDISNFQIGCIENYRNADYTENVLLAYALKKDSTLGKLVEALKQIQRIDAITSSQKHLKALRIEAIKENIEHCSPDSNYTDDFIIKPVDAFLTNLQEKAFITLKDITWEQNKKTKFTNFDDVTLSKVIPKSQNIITEIAVQSQAPTSNRINNKCSKKVMVTFADDGENIARDLAKVFRKKRGNIHPIGVLILNDHRNKVLSNPENFIINYFHKMDFIIPIVTEGYLARIGGEPAKNCSTLSSLDPQYIEFIHDLILKYYANNKCKNDKIRTIIPENSHKKILQHPEMKKYPMLWSFAYESELEELAKRILHIYN